MTEAEINLRIIVSKYFDICKVNLLDCNIDLEGTIVPITDCTLAIGDSTSISGFRLVYNRNSVHFTAIRRKALALGTDVSRMYRVLFDAYFLFTELVNKLALDIFPKDLIDYKYLKHLDRDTLESIYLFLSYKVPLPHYYEVAVIKAFFCDYVRNNHKIEGKQFNMAVACYTYCQDYVMSFLFPDICKALKSLLTSLQRNGRWSQGEVGYADKLLTMLLPKNVRTAKHIAILKNMPDVSQATQDILGEMSFSQARYGLSQRQHTYLYVDRFKPSKRLCLFSAYSPSMYDYLETTGFSIPVYFPTIESRVFKAEAKPAIAEYTGLVLTEETAKDVSDEIKKLEKSKVIIEDKIERLPRTKEDYDRLKQDQVLTRSKLDKLNELLRRSKAMRKKDVAIIGAVVTVVALEEKLPKNSYMLVEHSGGVNNRVSKETPFFKAIRGKRSKDIFRVVGPNKDVFYYKILSIR